MTSHWDGWGYITVLFPSWSIHFCVFSFRCSINKYLDKCGIRVTLLRGEMHRASFRGNMRGFSGGYGRTAAGIGGMASGGGHGNGMFTRHDEAYGQDRSGYEGQERNRGALDGSEDVQGGGSGSGGAVMTPDEARDERMKLRSMEDYYCRAIGDCDSRIEYHKHAIHDLCRQILYYSYDTRIECYYTYHHTVCHVRKILDYLSMISRHTYDRDVARAELNKLMDLS